MTIRVVIADDQNLVRSGLGMILATQSDIEVVAEAQDGYEVVFSLGELDPAFIDNEILLADTANAASPWLVTKITGTSAKLGSAFSASNT